MNKPWADATSDSPEPDLSPSATAERSKRTHHGVVRRWGQTSGKIVDHKGRMWEAPTGVVPASLDTIAPGMAVTFNGDPDDRQDEQYPQAYNVQVVKDGTDTTKINL